MMVIDSGVVFAGKQNTDAQSCAFPGVCVTNQGRWLCIFRAAPKKGDTRGQRVLITWSDDMGKNWNKPINPFIPKSVNGKKGLFRTGMLTSLKNGKIIAVLCWVDHSEPELPFFNEKTEGLLNTRIFTSESTDNGLSWTEPEIVETPFNVPVPITGPILSLANGDLACQFELNKHYYDTQEWRHSSVMVFSKDGGKSWVEHSIVSNDPENRIFYWDQRPSVLLDGRILDVFWTFDKKTGKYLNIHANESLDNGRSWSSMWDTGVVGQPAPTVALKDGKIAMVYVDRTNEPIIKMRLSSNNGKTWCKDTEIDIYKPIIETQTQVKQTMQDAWAEMGKFSIGLPITAYLSDGTILVIFYAGKHTDITDIRWARINTDC